MSCNIDNLTIKEAREIASLLGAVKPSAQSHSWVIGQQVLIRTVTMYYTGRIAVVTDSDVGLDDAAWIANAGRFATTLRDGFPKDAEIEPYPDGVRCFVSRGAVVDFCEFKKSLPRTQQ